jgi:uncharacterized protein (TIGR02231 family)
MRPFSAVLAVFMLSTAPAALLAETIEARSTVTRVTIFPGLAQVVRTVQVTGPAGANQLIVPDLPEGTDANSIRVTGEGVTIGALSLAEGRQPATADLTAPDVKAAEDEVKRLDLALAQKLAAVAGLRLQAKASDEEIGFLRGLNQRAPAATSDELRATAQMVNDETLAAAKRAFEAEQQALAAERALIPDREALDKAKKALAALTDAGKHVTLLATVQGSGRIEITTYTDSADWSPVYDLRLDRKAKTLTLERGAFVTQHSGEDWTNVDLTLSTARPSEQSTPSEVYPQLRRIYLPQPMGDAAPVASKAAGMAMEAAPVMAAPAPVVARAQTAIEGGTVTYHYPSPATLRDGVEQVRLALDNVTLPAKAYAQVVPAQDSSAFLMAKARNDSGQVLLPGDAVLFADGVVVGTGSVPLTAAGADLSLGFGAIDGLRASLTTPVKSAGDRGILSKSNEQHEVSVLKVENLTAETWPLRILAATPYSEQDDLVIHTRMTPPPTETDIDGKRGVMGWQSDIGPGATTQVQLDTTLDWPAGQELQ